MKNTLRRPGQAGWQYETGRNSEERVQAATAPYITVLIQFECVA